jgi:hypothetical protein
MYHGNDNRFKAAHEEGCPIRDYDGFVLGLLDDNPELIRCTCGFDGRS